MKTQLLGGNNNMQTLNNIRNVENDIVIFRDPSSGFMYYSFGGKTHIVNLYQGELFKTDLKFNNIRSAISDLIIKEVPTTDGYRAFAFMQSPITKIIAAGGRSGGGGGIKGIKVEDEDIPLGTFTILNFEGPQVVVTNDGSGKATVTVGGGGMITGGGTINRLSMFTAPTVIGDSPFLRSGNDVIADGNMFFASGNGIDVTASGGADVLSIGVNNADVINYGYAGTTHNFSGAVFNELTTNLNIKDKLITINDGGAAGSGGNTGFEIEEAGVATGYFIQNATRDGFDFQASAVTGVATFDLSGLTGNQTATLQDASGTLAYLSDIPAPISAWLLDGNTVGAEKWIGTIDNFNFPIRTNNTVRGLVDNGGLWAIGSSSTTAGTRLAGTGTGTTSATYTAQFFNSTPTIILSIRDDQRVGIRTSAPGSPLHIYNTGNEGIRMSIDGGIADRYKIYLDSVSEDATYIGNNIRHLFYAGGGGSEFVMAIAGAGVTNGRVSIAPLASANFLGNKFYVETSLNNDMAIRGKTLGAGATADYAGYFEAVGAGTFNAGSFFTATGATTNMAITTEEGNVGIGTALTAIGTGNRVLAIKNGTEPNAALADSIKIFSVDSDDTTSTLGLYLEQTVVTETVISDRTLKIKINGTIYKVCLKV